MAGRRIHRRRQSLYSILDVWKGTAVNGDLLLELFDTTLVGEVLDELSAKYLLCRIEIYSVPQVLEPATCERPRTPVNNGKKKGRGC